MVGKRLHVTWDVEKNLFFKDGINMIWLFVATIHFDWSMPVLYHLLNINTLIFNKY